MNNNHERRSSIRRPIHHEAILHLGDTHHVPCVIADYCADGMFLKFDRSYDDFLKALEKEDQLDLSFKDARGHEYHIASCLAHAMSGALGIRFTERHLQAVQALVVMNRVERKAPAENAKKIIEECIELIQSKTLPLMSDLWPQLIEEVRHASVNASSDQKANALMAAAEKLDRSQRELQASFSLGIQDPLSTYQQHLETAAKMNDSLTLVDKNEFEDWLISRVLITKVETQFRSELLPLKVRLDAVGIGDKNHHQSAFGPALLVSAFHSAIVPMAFDISMEKTAFRVFEKHVMMSLDGLYEGLNGILIKHNILPDLDLAKAVKSKAPSPPVRNKPTPKTNTENETSPDSASDARSASVAGAGLAQGARHGGEVPRSRSSSFISSLGRPGIADAQSAAFTAPPFQSVSAPPGAGSETSSAIADGNASRGHSFQQNQAKATEALQNVVGLMRSLREKSAEQSAGTEMTPDSSVAHYSEGELEDGLSVLQGASDAGEIEGRESLMTRVEDNLRQQGEDKAIDENQKVAIDVVDRFFYSMRNNPRISSEAKQHLLKLEVPVLKVLLKDERFFDDHNSSVRAVMNRIAQLGAKGATLSPSSRRRVSELVEQIVDQFEQDTQVFDVVLAELDQLIERQNKLYVKNVERVAAAADGVHKVDEAKAAVAQALNNRLSDRKVPSAVSVLIENGWKDLLNLTHIKYGEDSEQWHTYLSVLDRLIAYGENPEIPVETKKILPVIQEGLKQVSGTNEASGTVRESLKDLIQNAPRGSHSMTEATLQEVPETEDEVVQRNLHKSQALKPWVVRAKSIEAGTWMRLEREHDEPQYIRLVWIAKGYSKFVCVNHQGMKVIELGLLKFASYLRDQRITLEFDYEVPIVNQSLDNMVAEVYDKLAYESNHDEGSGLIKRSEFCRQVRALMKTGKRTAECNLIYLRFYDGLKDSAAQLSDSFAKGVAAEVSPLIGGGILGRVNGSDFVAFIVDGDTDFLGLRCQDALDTLCEAEEDKLTVLIGESKAHMGFYNPESMIRHALALIEDDFETVKAGGASMLDEAASTEQAEVLHAMDAEPEDEPTQSADQVQADGDLQTEGPKAPRVYIEESENILPDVHDFNALELELRTQKVDCLNTAGADVESGEAGKARLLADHINLLCFVKGAEEAYEVSDYSEAQKMDEWWLEKLLSLTAQSNPVFEDYSFVRVQLSAYALNDQQLVERLVSLGQQGQLQAEKICFDIYDCSVIEDVHTSLDYMKQLKSEGFKFCLDHFGSERSPFAFLKALPFDMIKIDESFMNALNKSEEDDVAADSIIEIAHYLGKKVLANAVDSAICLQKMKHLKVDYVQGATVSALDGL